MHRLSGLAEQFSLVGDSLRKLFPHGELFAAELQTSVAQTQKAAAAPPAPLAMEVATSLLYIDAALEDGDFDDPAHADRVRRLAERLGAVRQAAPPQPLEPWMEELYRRVSDRQTMGSVVQELRASLDEVEKAIDAFFRDPAEHAVLLDVPKQLGAMRGVLSVLGMDPAAQALLRMRNEVDGLVSTEIDEAHIREAGVFDRLAGNLSALGFMIDMLAVQPQMAKSLFAYDAVAGTLAPVMGRSEPAKIESSQVESRLIEQVQLLAFSSVRQDVPLQDVRRDLERLAQEAQAADQPALAAAVAKAQSALGKAIDDPEGAATARGELSEALVEYVSAATAPEGLRADDRSGAAGTERAGRDRRELRGRRRDARGLPRGGSRGHRSGAGSSRGAAPSTRRSGPAHGLAPCLPHLEGQLANGRVEGVRRRRAGPANSSSTRSLPSSTRPNRVCSSSRAGCWPT